MHPLQGDSSYDYLFKVRPPFDTASSLLRCRHTHALADIDLSHSLGRLDR